MTSKQNKGEERRIPVSDGSDRSLEWLPPLFLREFRQGVRSKSLVLTLTSFPFVLLALFLLMYVPKPGLLQVETEALLWFVVGLTFVLAFPLWVLWGPTEKERGAEDVLFLTPQSGFGRVSQQWLSRMAWAGLLAVMVIPFLTAQLAWETVDLSEEFIYLGEVFLLSGCLVALGIWMSGQRVVVRAIWSCVLVTIFLLRAAYSVTLFDNFYLIRKFREVGMTLYGFPPKEEHTSAGFDLSNYEPYWFFQIMPDAEKWQGQVIFALCACVGTLLFLFLAGKKAAKKRAK